MFFGLNGREEISFLGTNLCAFFLTLGIMVAIQSLAEYNCTNPENVLWIFMFMAGLFMFAIAADLLIFLLNFYKNYELYLEKNKSWIKIGDLIYTICGSTAIMFGLFLAILHEGPIPEPFLRGWLFNDNNAENFILYSFGAMTIGIRLSKAIYECFFQPRLEKKVKLELSKTKACP